MSHQLSLHNMTELRTTRPNYRTPGLPGSDKKEIVNNDDGDIDDGNDGDDSDVGDGG